VTDTDDQMTRKRTSVDKKTTAATFVYDNLRNDILRGDFHPGQRLQIESVASRYGVGTNPVREALNRLSSERLVDRHDQRGFFVPPVSVADLTELVATRCWLEGKALELSIANKDQAWEEKLVLAHHRLTRANWNLPGHGVPQNTNWEDCHRAFHLSLIANCGSKRLSSFCEELMYQAERYRHIAIAATYPMRLLKDEHKGIMDAAIEGDATLAVERLTEHYKLTLHILEGQIATTAAQPEA
jgi:GntR family transcriptional regulator, carbon starvation induced regulator